MTGGAPYDPASVPCFGRGMKFRYDAVRGAWVVLGPERLFMPDEHAIEVLKLVDGTRDVGVIVGDLASRYDAPAAEIAADVWAMLQDLAARGALRL